MRCFLPISISISVTAMAVASAFDLPTKVVYNASASAPIGFYWIDQKLISRGDHVLVRLPKRVRNLVNFRQYLPPNVPLVKRVVGIEGDKICRRGQDILINKITVAVARIEDELGRKLPEWSGCSILGADSFFLLQDHPKSFDGRYFGPIDRALVVGRARKLRIF